MPIRTMSSSYTIEDMKTDAPSCGVATYDGYTMHGRSWDWTRRVCCSAPMQEKECCVELYRIQETMRESNTSFEVTVPTI
jgi:hypothetical protein